MCSPAKSVMKPEYWRQRLIPRSLVSRMLLLTLLAVALAQTFSSLLWVNQFQNREIEGLQETTHDLALSAASTVRFFTRLPLEYRHIVLDQLRNMGGTRFFVSLNKEEIRIIPTPDTSRKQLVLDEFTRTLTQVLGSQATIKVEFSRPQDLRILNNDTLLSDLPRSWSHFSISYGNYSPPVLVTQIEVAKGEWLYLAALLPAPYVTLEDNYFTLQQAFFLLFTAAFLLLFIFTLVRWQIRPLRNLARAAQRLSSNLDQPPLKIMGSSEIQAASVAFNAMQQRLRRYIDDRERLFSSISHDLKTPITRLRLRVELLDDEVKYAKFNQDLDELEMMVKGALQTVKDTDIHENIEPIDLNKMLRQMLEDYNATATGNASDPKVVLEGKLTHPYRGKPLALKRCLTNLIDNALKYGTQVTVRLAEADQRIVVAILDDGPGVPEEVIERLFEPYYRLDRDKEISGTGLGLGIARNIVHAHGGQLSLANRPEGGLEVNLSLPRN